MTEDKNPEWVSVQEAALILSVDVPVVHRLIETGVLDRYRLRGRYIRLRGDQVAEAATIAPEILRRC